MSLARRGTSLPRNDYFLGLPVNLISMARTSTRTINLEKYIEFPAAAKVDGFSGINFHFDSQVIAKIHQAQQRGTRLQVSKQLQTQLRCCALLGLESYIQSGLSVCTYYQREDCKEPVIKSLLSPDGDMLHQVSSYYLNHRQDCRQITASHYWLLQQLTRHLAWQRTRIVDILAWSIALLCTLGLLLLYPQSITANILAWGIVILVTWGLQKLLKFIFRFQAGSLDQWAIAKFLSLSSSPQPGQQKMAKFFLQYFVV